MDYICGPNKTPCKTVIYKLNKPFKFPQSKMLF